MASARGLRSPQYASRLLLALLMLLPAGIAEGAARKSHPYRKHWKHATVGKGALGRVAAGAGVAQLRKTPRKYGGGASGFGKRLGAGFATNAVKATVEHGVAARLHEDLHYHRSTKHGVAPRLAHALTSTVVARATRRTANARPPRGACGHAAAGAFTQGALAAGSGASTAGIGLAAEAGTNVVREFVRVAVVIPQEEVTASPTHNDGGVEVYPFTYASFAATFPSRTVKTSAPCRCHGSPLRFLRYTHRTTARSPLTMISSASN